MDKSSCIEIFNNMIRDTPISFTEKLLLVSEYLTEINYENSDKVIYLISQNPQLIQQTIPKIEDYFCRKYCILKLQTSSALNDLFNNFKTILYYEWCKVAD